MRELHFQEKNSKHFYELMKDSLRVVNPTFQRIFRTFLNYQKLIINPMILPYSNAKLEATSKLIKDIKRQAVGFRNFEKIKPRFYSLLMSDA